MSSLVVLLPRSSATAATEFAYVLTSDGRQPQAHASAPASLLPQATGAGAEVVAIVPHEALSWHQVQLPRGTARGSARLRAVLEGLLEDRLLDEPDTLHLAVAPGRGNDGPLWIAACDRAWLRSALQVLETARRPASRIVPEFAPEGDGALYGLGDADRPVWVAAGPDGVFSAPLSQASLALLPTLPDGLPVVAEPAVAALAEHASQRQVVLQQAPQRWLQAMQSRWDLAQFDFASSGRARSLKKFSSGWGEFLREPRWRPARWGIALLVAANLAGLNAWAWQERAAIAGKRDAARAALTQTFPQVKVVVDAPVQMEKEVAALRQAAGGSAARDLEAMLAALGRAAPGQSLTAIEFAATGLRVRGLATNGEQVQAVAQRLRADGYTAVAQGETLMVTFEGSP